MKVQDNGLGIKEEDKNKVFLMYQRLHDHVEGTGVGMAIVKRIVDNTAGKIELDSKLGEGFTFKIHLVNSRGIEAESQKCVCLCVCGLGADSANPCVAWGTP